MTRLEFWLLGLAALSLVASVIFGRRTRPRNAAYSSKQPHDSHMDIRDAGPAAMRDKTSREWTETDEDLDESFPASDPPGNY